MKPEVSSIVLSLNGRDKEKLFFVVHTDENYVWLSDGKSRKLSKPKCKKVSHVLLISDSAPQTALGIREKTIRNKELIKALAVFKAEREIEKEGHTIGQR